ncbi:putative RNA-directed DNA polymerase from transposon BS, partial [Stegodyphus mimosarum]
MPCQKIWELASLSFDPKIPNSKVWKIIKSLSSSHIPKPAWLSILAQENRDLNTICSLFSSEFNPPANPIPSFPLQLIDAYIFLHKPPLTHALDSPFLSYELRTAICSLRVNSSEGPDGIPNKTLKLLPVKKHSLLLSTFNFVWNYSQFLSSWKHSIIIPIPKPGKDLSSPSSYRPICLSSCLGKLFEKLVKNRLSWAFENFKIYNPHLYGFRSNSSAIDIVLFLTFDIQDALHNKKEISAIFFDLKSAFGSVNPRALLCKFLKLGFGTKINKYIQFFLSPRDSNIKLGSHLSSPFRMEHGSPQEGVLSPLLFNLTLNDLPSLLNSNIRIAIFADDIAIWSISDKDIYLQYAIDQVCDYCTEWGFSLAPEKCRHLFFSKKRRPLPPTLLIYDLSIPLASSHKFLGVTFDSKLSFLPDIKQLTSKTSTTSNILKSCTGTSIGRKPP